MSNILPNQKLDDMFSELEVSDREDISEKPKIELKEQELTSFEQEPKNIEQQETKPKSVNKPDKVKRAPVQSVQTPEMNELYHDVEDILEQNLTQIYYNIPPKKQAEFKKVGEETAQKISQILSSVKVKADKIFKLIIKWLKVIPGINKHYIEQESKIKTDKLLELRNKNFEK